MHIYSRTGIVRIVMTLALTMIAIIEDYFPLTTAVSGFNLVLNLAVLLDHI